MSEPVEQRVRAVLHAEAEPAVPLSRLHRALAVQAGDSVGTYAQLHERLRSRPELFNLVEPPPLPWDAAAWPEDIRRQYQDELRRVGLVAEPRVALRVGSPPPASRETGIGPVLHRLDASLLDLWGEIADDLYGRASIADAMAQADALRRAARRVANDES